MTQDYQLVLWLIEESIVGILSRHYPFLKRIHLYFGLALDVVAIFVVVSLREEFAAVGLDSSLFVCCWLIYIWKTLSAIIPAPWVAWLTWEAAYNSVCNAGTKVRDYVFDVYHRF